MTQQRQDRSTDRLISMVIAVVVIVGAALVLLTWAVAGPFVHITAPRPPGRCRIQRPRRLDGADHVRDDPARRDSGGHARVSQRALRVRGPGADDGGPQRSRRRDDQRPAGVGLQGHLSGRDRVCEWRGRAARVHVRDGGAARVAPRAGARSRRRAIAQIGRKALHVRPLGAAGLEPRGTPRRAVEVVSFLPRRARSAFSTTGS